MPDISIPGPFADWLRALQRGEKEFPNCDGERHHYVPEFLLKRFRGPGHKLFQLDKRDGTCEPIVPKEAAWDRNLYTVESTTGEHDGIIEGFFSLAENFAAKSLGTLLNAPKRFTDDDRANLAFLLAIQEQRVPGYLEEWDENLAQAGTVWAAVQLANVEGSKGRKRRARESAKAITEGQVKIRPTKENLLTLVLAGLGKTIIPAYMLPWTLLRASEGSFVCSDRPLTMHDPTPPHPWAGAAWLSSEMVVTTMPLSSTACLRISPQNRDHFAERRTVKHVGHINLRTYGWATRYVYGPSAEVLQRLHERALADPEAVPTPTKKRMVMLEDISTADPKVAERNAAKGWPRYLPTQEDDGSVRMMSYEVIESVDDARKSVAPRAGNAHDGEEWASELTGVKA